MQIDNELKYMRLLNYVWAYGSRNPSRAGETLSLPGQHLTLDLRTGFPLLTTRKMYPAGVWGELAAFVRGAEDLATFEKYGCHYWDANAAAWWVNKDKPRSEWQIGKSYGSLWRNFEGVDQLANVIEAIKADPYSRRHVVSAWHPAAEACLPSCHIMFQFYVRNNTLNCHVYMRSVDLCVGLPSDILLYATLMLLVAKDTSLEPALLTFSFGDAHMYTAHLEGWNVQIGRTPKTPPIAKLSDKATTLSFEPDDISLVGYDHHPAIKYVFLS